MKIDDIEKYEILDKLAELFPESAFEDNIASTEF